MKHDTPLEISSADDDKFALWINLQEITQKGLFVPPGAQTSF